MPLTQERYRAYGDVVSERTDIRSKKANLGFADRFDFLTPLENLRPDSAKANLCIFRCQPMMLRNDSIFEVKLLEKHAFSTQVFLPMNSVGRYLVIVCQGGDSPDLSTLQAFLASGSQGISYKPGVWHHPLVAMDQPSDFACLVFEAQNRDDCTVIKLPITCTISL